MLIDKYVQTTHSELKIVGKCWFDQKKKAVLAPDFWIRAFLVLHEFTTEAASKYFVEKQHPECTSLKNLFSKYLLLQIVAAVFQGQLHFTATKPQPLIPCSMIKDNQPMKHWLASLSETLKIESLMQQYLACSNRKVHAKELLELVNKQLARLRNEAHYEFRRQFEAANGIISGQNADELRLEYKTIRVGLNGDSDVIETETMPQIVEPTFDINDTSIVSSAASSMTTNSATTTTNLSNSFYPREAEKQHRQLVHVQPPSIASLSSNNAMPIPNGYDAMHGSNTRVTNRRYSPFQSQPVPQRPFQSQYHHHCNSAFDSMCPCHQHHPTAYSNHMNPINQSAYQYPPIQHQHHHQQQQSVVNNQFTQIQNNNNGYEYGATDPMNMSQYLHQQQPIKYSRLPPLPSSNGNSPSFCYDYSLNNSSNHCSSSSSIAYTPYNEQYNLSN